MDVDKIITLEELNEAIANFPYGKHESNKPRPIYIEKRKSKLKMKEGFEREVKFKQSAAESLCLLRYFAMIIGPRILKGNKYYKMYLLLRRITGILTYPTFKMSDVWTIKQQIRKHHEKYLELFGELKPKMHFLLHYPAMIVKFGPPRYYWCMQFERKNKEMKDYIAGTKCFKNLLWTIAVKNQLHLSYTRKTNKNYSSYNLGTIKNIADSEISLAYPEISSLPSYDFIIKFGKKFRVGTVLISRFDLNSGDPVISIIRKIFQIGGKICLFLSNFEHLKYDFHVCAHLIHNLADGVWEVCLLDEIALLSPPTALSQNDGTYYVISKYEVF